MADMIPVHEARRGMTAFLAAPDRQDHLSALLANKGIDVRSFCAAVVADTMRQPKLALAVKQAPETLMEQLSVAAATGLLPGSAYGQFYLIPRWASKAQRNEVTSITGYKGLCDVAYRHERVHRVEAFVVFDGEEFEYDPGAGTLRHVWKPDAKRDSFDAVVAAYSRVVLTTPNGQHVDERPLFHVLTRAEIEKTRASSESFKRGYGPWVEHPIPMVRKTPLRRALSNGSVPRRYDLIHLLGHESSEEHRVAVDAEPSEKTGIARLGDVLGVQEPDMAAARARLAELTKDAPDYTDPEMMSDGDVLAALRAIDDGDGPAAVRS